eukprot:g3365.t1
MSKIVPECSISVEEEKSATKVTESEGGSIPVISLRKSVDANDGCKGDTSNGPDENVRDSDTKEDIEEEQDFDTVLGTTRSKPPLKKDSTAKVNDIASILSATIKDMEGDRRPFGMISINNPLRASWDGIIILCLVYIFFLVPMEVAFDEPSSIGWIILGNTVDLIFWVDIFICFRTTFVDGGGQEIWDPKKVAKAYMKDFFLIDLICSLPGFPFSIVIENYLIEGGGGEATLVKLGKAPRVLKVVRTVKVVKVFRVLRIARYLQDIKDTVQGLGTFVKMFKLLVLTTFFLHINACLFAFIATFDERDSWILVNHLQDRNWGEKYLNALYWSATTSTTVGYGDIAPANKSEKIFCIMSMCVGVCLYGYIIGSMTEMVTSTSYVDNKVQQQLDEVHAFINRHRLPRVLVRHVLTFFRHHFKRKKMIDERRIMEMMPHELLRQCQFAILKDTDMSMFKMMDSRHFPVVMELLLPRSYADDEVIIGPTDSLVEPNLEFFVLLEGRVDIYSFGPDEAHIAKTHEQRISDQIPTIEQMYNLYGVENDSMTHAQLENMLTALLGRKPTKEQVEMTMLEIDDDGSGTIEVEEFVEWFVAKNIEGPKKCGTLQKELTPVSMFGSYTGFGIGNSNVTYMAHGDCDVYTISSERLVHEFSAFKDVMNMINFCLVEPAQKYGPLVDVLGPNREARKVRMDGFSKKMKKEKLAKAAPALQRLTSKVKLRKMTREGRVSLVNKPLHPVTATKKINPQNAGEPNSFMETVQNAFLIAAIEKKLVATEKRVLDAVGEMLKGRAGVVDGTADGTGTSGVDD